MTEARPARTAGFSRASILSHWLSAVLVVALFFTHEAERGSAAFAFHVSGGAIVGLFLLWRVWHRIRRGTADVPDQAAFFNLLARAVHWALLVLIVIVVVSGYLLPWSLGRPLDVYGLAIPSPMDANRGFHELMERVHDAAGHLFIPLLALHFAGAIKHAIFDRRGAGLRMFRAVKGGR